MREEDLFGNVAWGDGRGQLMGRQAGEDDVWGRREQGYGGKGNKGRRKGQGNGIAHYITAGRISRGMKESRGDVKEEK